MNKVRFCLCINSKLISLSLLNSSQKEEEEEKEEEEKEDEEDKENEQPKKKEQADDYQHCSR